MKYEFTGEEKDLGNGTILKRIRATRSFGWVREGTVGGWIQKEGNLSHQGTCWIHDDAVVMENATVTENGQVKDMALVTGNAQIFGDARVVNDATVMGHARAFGRATVAGQSFLGDLAEIFDNAKMTDAVQVRENARIYGRALIHESAVVKGKAWVYHDAECLGNAQVSGEGTKIGAYCRVDGKCTVTPTFLYGMPYYVTMMDKTMRIGCLSFDREFWGKLEPEKMRDSIASQEEMDVYWMWATYKDHVLVIWDNDIRYKQELEASHDAE